MLYWLRETVQGNLGYRFKTGEPVDGGDRPPDRPDADADGDGDGLSGSASGVVLGVLAAVRQYSFLDSS